MILQRFGNESGNNLCLCLAEVTGIKRGDAYFSVILEMKNNEEYRYHRPLDERSNHLDG